MGGKRVRLYDLTGFTQGSIWSFPLHLIAFIFDFFLLSSYFDILATKDVLTQARASRRVNKDDVKDANI